MVVLIGGIGYEEATLCTSYNINSPRAVYSIQRSRTSLSGIDLFYLWFAVSSGNEQAYASLEKKIEKIACRK